MTIQQSEIAVVGGGMIGSAMALGLAQNGFQIAVIERHEPPIFNAGSQPDVRVSAIRSASVALLKSLGVWDAIKAMRAHPYRRLEVWEWEDAHVVFDACEFNLPELGFMIENRVLQRALWNALSAHPAVKLLCPAQLKKIYRRHSIWILELIDKQTLLEVPIIIGADGANSQIRQLTGIGIQAWQYYQSCILITVKCEVESGDSTWQHFTPAGPHAFLPLYDNWASLVWYDTPVNIRQLQSMTMLQLQEAIVNTFPSRLGRVIPVASCGFSLTRLHAMQYVQNRLAIIGDAAHTIHPIAGQGVNLGYCDVDVLLKVITDARNYGEDWTDISVLKRYQSRRQIDNCIMQILMDLFHMGFSNNLALLRVVRNLGLMVVQRSSMLKRWILKYALGL